MAGRARMRARGGRSRLFRRVRRPGVGDGIVARAAIPRGGVVHRWAGCRILPGPTYRSVQVGVRSHVHDPACLNLLNHSCEPSTRIDVPRRAVVALRDIRPGELLTIFYPATEWDMARPFRCRCGSRRCLRRIRGARYTPVRRLRDMRLARHIRRLLAGSTRAGGRRRARVGGGAALPSKRRVV